MPMELAAGMAQLRRTRITAIRVLRWGFERRGFDVSSYTDDAVAAALRQEAVASQFGAALFARAFQRLQLSDPPKR